MLSLMSRGARSKRGFTLIELLVVIAIIAILAAILFPVFTKARDQAKLSRCLVHLQEIGSAIIAYVDDYDGRYPIGPSYHYDADWNITSTDSGWVSQFVGGISRGAGFTLPKDRPLYKYTAGNLDIWKCPSERKQHNAPGVAADYPSNYWGTSYIMNGVYAWDGAWPENTDCPNAFYVLMGHSGENETKNNEPRTTSEIKHPTKIWMMGERTLHYYWNKKYKETDAIPSPLGHQRDKPFSPVVYCDGHAGTIMMTEDVLADPGKRWAFIEKGWLPNQSKWPNEGL